MFKATIKTQNLSSALDTINVLVDECKIQLKEDSLQIRAVDPANVGMVDLKINNEAFESLEATEGVIGVDLGKLREAVNMANSDDLIHLSLDEKTRKLHINVDGLSYTMALIDPDSIREEPDIPELDLPAEVIIEGAQLDKGIRAADMVSDHLGIRFSPDDETLHIEAQGDTDDTNFTIQPDEMIDYTAGSADSLFSNDYLKDVNKAIPKDAEVRMYIGEEFPVKMFFAPEEHINATYMVAPRISDN